VQVDRYTKIVLTVIAACLVWLCAMNTGRPVQARQLTAMPATLPGGVQPVVVVGWGSMDMTGRIALNLIGPEGNTRTDTTLSVRADRPLHVDLPYTPDNPLPARVTSTHDNPLPIEIAAFGRTRKDGSRSAPKWNPRRREANRAAVSPSRPPRSSANYFLPSSA